MVKAAVLIECPDFVNEYDKLLFRVNSPRVVIDNAVCDTATVVKVDCPRKHGILLEAVQVLTDLNLSIKKAYISSDGRWLMDVYHLTDVNGEKVTDKSIINSIEESLSTIHYERSTGFDGLTALELTGTDRVGLLSEIFAVLSNLQCNVVDAKVWTHNGRVASLIYLKDFDTGSPIEDKQKIAQIEGLLRNVLKGDDHNDTKSARTAVSLGVVHTERRLHQMMFDDRDYDCRPVLNRGSDSPIVTVQNWAKRLYSVINVQCRDRTKLLFDVVCTLTDMDYIVFHATIYTSEHQAYLEFYIRHKDGTPINSEPENQRVIQCLKAAIERRETQGIRLELCTEDRKGLLAEITRTFRENGLNVTKAEISTSAAEKTAHNSFYVTDAVGHPADLKIVGSVCEKIGLSHLRVVESPSDCGEKTKEGHENGEALLVSIGSLVKRFMRSVS